MKIRKPHNFIPYKKYPDRYFDLDTGEEFPHSEINEHPIWYKEEYNNDGNIIYRQYSNGDWAKWEYNILDEWFKIY